MDLCDIGCGMCFQQTNIPVEDVLQTKTTDGQSLVNAILGNIIRNVPVGFKHHKTPKQWVGFDLGETYEVGEIVKNQLERAQYQLGTLGNGNHFIELQKNEDGNLAIMIHSGSRNMGKQICDYYNNLAKELNIKWFSSIPKEFDLAFLPKDSEEGQEYWASMQFAQIFAEENRRRIMIQAKNVVLNMVEKYIENFKIVLDPMINAHHNYATLEHHMGHNVIVHRKGAIRIQKEELGIIPGSMETASYIVKGKGCVMSFNSASHGSGRRLGRIEAMRQHSCQEVLEGMKQKGITLCKPNKEDVASECGKAYKNIDEVMDNQAEIVDIVHKLTPIGVIKG